ncbi:MAG TPA: hypothetical protein DCF68_02165 [Cyanothece sp. UBA12306]|nr:hypothetical protein [Cyanothece sp. UBA12306]
MKRKSNLLLLGLGFSLSLMVMGCTPPSDADQFADYQLLNLDQIQGELRGDNPEAMTLELFGIKGEVEGNFSQDIKVLSNQGFNKIVMLTQMNLPDDSIRGMRYLLEFEFSQSEGKWLLSQVGRQQSCSRSENSTDWTTESCL